jgi:hypothetical protein
MLIRKRLVLRALEPLILATATARRCDPKTFGFGANGTIDDHRPLPDQQWKLRIERAQYEGKRAERQYDACDPDNRVVARTLETRWNDKLAGAERIEREHQELKQRRRLELNDIERQRILGLADDLPKLWRSEKTTDRDRKVLLRLLSMRSE